MKLTYRNTIYSCFVSYVIQAIINNFAPLLFLTFQKNYDIPLRQITLLIWINFVVQLLTDIAATFLADKIGYRICIIAAHILSAAGMISMAVLPEITSSPFIGLIISVSMYAIGGGLIEVLVSPIVEACPNDRKEQTMSILHSFYCWGSLGVIIISTVFFNIFGINNWKILAAIWAAIPVINGLFFIKTPIASLIEEGETALPIKSLIRNKSFIIFMIIIFCAGASELTVSQWSSAFVEKNLGISKTAGDLLGPAAFSVMMGLGRLFYGKFGDNIDLDKVMKASGILCVLSFLTISLVPSPVISLIGMALSGLSVAILWPGTFSCASASIRNGGSAMFAILAMCGDIGCASGPAVAGIVSGMFSDDLKKGILAAVIFPVIMLIFMHCNKKPSASKEK